MEESIDEIKKHLLEHVELTRQQSNAHERHLRLLREDFEIIYKAKISNLDIFIDLAKSIFSVAFTGYVALKVANPEWINFSQDATLFTEVAMSISLLALIFFTNQRKKVAEDIVENSKKRSEAAGKLWEAESNCISEIIAIHNKALRQGKD